MKNLKKQIYGSQPVEVIENLVQNYVIVIGII